jgi:hypothetical protein
MTRSKATNNGGQTDLTAIKARLRALGLPSHPHPWTEDELIEEFNQQGNAPAFWRVQARELLAASAALMELWNSAIQYDPPDPVAALDYDGPAIMLRAMAFECLLKACALDRRLVLAKAGQYVRIPGVRNHDLVGLAKVVGFEMNKQEEMVLRRLSRWITAGRYPIQRRWTDQIRLRPEGLKEYLCVGWNPAWDDICEGLIRRLSGHVF